MEVISEEFIKPISPTPNHLKSYEYSMIDQFSTSHHTPILLFYPPPPLVQDQYKNPKTINSSRSKHLKKSLSQILAHYYPLAGRLANNNNTFIDCNDEGVPFLEAIVHNHPFEDILKNIHENKLTKSLLPRLTTESFSLNVLLMVQATFFKCGGIVVGISATHKILDAPSLITFITDWATLARQDDPNFKPTELVPLARVVPPLIVPPTQPSVESFIASEPCITNVYEFNPSNIANLKIKATREDTQRPTRVEVVTSILWKCLTADAQRASLLTHLVNLRKRVDPPMHEHHIGNFIGFLVASKQKDENDIGNTVGLLRKALVEFKHKYLDNWKVDDEAFGTTIIDHLIESLGLVNKKDVNLYRCNSWCGFPFYDVDFGWGKPILFTTFAVKVMNFVQLIDTKDGGVEAWVTLSKEEAKIFEKNKVLLTYATLKASVTHEE